MVTAFTDDKRNKASFVIINNAEASRTVRVHLSAVTLSGALTGEQSVGDVRFKALGATAISKTSNDTFSVTVPAKSVTSVGGSY